MTGKKSSQCCTFILISTNIRFIKKKMFKAKAESQVDSLCALRIT